MHVVGPAPAPPTASQTCAFPDASRHPHRVPQRPWLASKASQPQFQETRAGSPSLCLVPSTPVRPPNMLHTKKKPGGLRFDQSTRQRWQECTNQAVTEGGLHCTHPTWPSLAYYIIHHPLQKLNSRMHHPSLVHNNSTRFKTLFLLFPPRPDLQGFFSPPPMHDAQLYQLPPSLPRPWTR